MATHTITAFFDRRADADQAVTSLKQDGIPASDITLLPAADQSSAYDATDTRGKGFWATLEDMFGGTEDHAAYAEGLRRGGTMVSVRTDEMNVDRTISVLEQYGSIDLDEREASWRTEGWTADAPVTTTTTTTTTSGLAGGMGLAATAGGLAATAPVTNYDERRETRFDTMAPEAGLLSTAQTTTASKGLAGRVGAAADEVIQIVEERLDIGKRSVSRGKVRIHSSVVEKAVSESITLHGETVAVDRHAVDRPVALGELSIDPFKERVIEMEEFDEEAVVAKSAHVVEEINLRKDAADRVETVRDTVRSTKVDIDDGRIVTTQGLGTAGVATTAYETLIMDNMDVVGSDGAHVGTVDHLDGSKIKLKKTDALAGGQHHFVPLDWIKSVEGKVMLQIPAAEAMDRWSAAA